ncbi:MAG: class I SAM-dependent methyltransferase [Clostridiales bacterium]|jgi:predicted O-methyltransferase YrrM|nr:class I SAM-dependent methyltransferase [Clostridiales bacterium]
MQTVNKVNLDEVKKLGKDYKIPIISHEVAQFLQTIVALKKPSQILEIGTGIGYSGCVLLKNASSSTRLISIEKNAQYVCVANHIFEQNFFDRAIVLQGDCRNIVPNLSSFLHCEQIEFDLIFMDGPKSAYVELLPYLVQLLSDGGVLICDNVLFRGLVQQNDGKSTTMIRKLRQFLCDVQKSPLITAILPVGDGISLSILDKH